MSSDTETCKSEGSEPFRPVLRKTQPKVPPKIPTKPPLKGSTKSRLLNMDLSTNTPESSLDLSPKVAPKKLKPHSPPAITKTPPASPKTPSPAALPLIPPKKTSKCSTKATMLPPLTPPPLAASPGGLAAAIKASKQEFHAQRRLRISGYGRKQGSCNYEKIVPEGIGMSEPAPSIVEKKRCGWITSQSDPAYISYHDEEWGVPVYNQILLFELLVLVGAQAELSWPRILSKREYFRAAFCGFDPAVVSNFNEKTILALALDARLSQPEAKIRGAVNNAKKLLEVAKEFGSFGSYLWSFLNHKQTANKHRLPKQVPVKSPKSEAISKDLIKRGFRFVGPTVVYSLMQAAGMVNDHLIHCFRHDDCLDLSDRNQAREAQGMILERQDEVVVW